MVDFPLDMMIMVIMFGDDDDDDDDDVCIEASDPNFVAIVGTPDLCIDASAACVPCVVASRLLPS